MTDPIDRIMRICNDGEDEKLTRIATIVCGDTPCQTREHWIGEAQRYMRYAQNAADISDRLRAALEDLVTQVKDFCKEQGEASFYTGSALAALGRSDSAVHEATLQALLPQRCNCADASAGNCPVHP